MYIKCIYIYKIYFGILHSLREENSAICNNMDKPGDPQAKWNKPDTERQILHGITYMWKLKSNEKFEHIETENKMVVSRN